MYLNMSLIALQEDVGTPNQCATASGTATQSSELDTSHGASHAFGNPNLDGTRESDLLYWHTLDQGPPIGAADSGVPTTPFWAAYDFGEGNDIYVSKVTMVYTNSTMRFPDDFEIQTSDDGTTWNTAASFTDTASLWAQDKPVTFGIGDPPPPIAPNETLTLSGYASPAPQTSVSVTPVITKGNTPVTPDSLEIVTQPAHGTATVNGLVLTYAPDDGFVGVDPFTYKAIVGGIDSSVANVQVIVEAPATYHVELCYSKDGGHTFSPWRSQSLGKQGAFNRRALFRRLGIGRRIVVKIRVSGDHSRDIVQAAVDTRPFP